MFPKFAGPTWVDWRRSATWLDCWSCAFLSKEIWIWPERSAPEAEPEIAEVSMSCTSVRSSPNLSAFLC